MRDTDEIQRVAETLMQARQAKRLLALHFPRGDGPADTQLLANQVSVREGLSQDFTISVQVLSDNADIALKDVLGKLVTVSLCQDSGATRYFNGYVFDFGLQRNDAGFAYYHMLLRPWLAFLNYRQDNYLFHDKTVEQQTAEIFADYDVRDWRAIGLAEAQAMTDACQFSESDYNYLHRRWEALGWCYWYEHREDGHTLVLCGDSTLAEPLAENGQTVTWQGRRVLTERGLWGFKPVRTVAATQYAATSFDFKNPRPAQAHVPTVNQQGQVPNLEVYEYAGGYGFRDQAAGDAFVRLRMEELEAAGKRFLGEGNDDRLVPGRWFRLVGHHGISQALQPQAQEGDDEFLITEVRHRATNNLETRDGGTAHYAMEVECLRRKIPWHPGRGHNSAEPKIYGLQTAIVVGPDGEEIHTDQYGRVRVQFHWDREGGFNEKSSAWVRVASTWAGSNFGFMAIPRIGQEVLVQFLDGNPDRPLITGRVYNQQNMPPWPLPDNKTQTGILSRSSTGGGYDNANALRFEDKKGAEQVWLHAERNQDIEVENDETHWVGNDRTKTIDRDETTHVKRNRTETVDRDETITVHNNRTERVDVDEKISIGQNRTEDVGQNETVSIGSNRSVTVGGVKTETVALAKAETVGLAKALTIGLGYQVSVGAAMNTTVALSQSQQIGKSKSTQVGNAYDIEAGDELSITVGKASLVMKSDGTIIINGHTFSVGTTDEQSFNADGNIVMKGKKILEN